MSEYTHSIAVTVSHFAPGPYGGGIVMGRDEQGAAWKMIVRHGCAPRDPQPGEGWRFTGHARNSGDLQLIVSRALPLVPIGRVIVEYLARNPRFVGVGRAYAQRLWDHYGERLYEILRKRDADALALVVGPFLAASIVLGWGLYSDEVETLAWLDRYGVAPRTAAQAIALWGTGARQRLESDPYALCLLEGWQSVDRTALRAGMLPDDERRLLAAIEEASSRRFARKHTAFMLEEFRAELHALLDRSRTRVARAVDRASAHGRLIRLPAELYQSRGPHEMERLVSEALQRRAVRRPDALCPSALDRAVSDAEASSGCTLGALQRNAVQMAVTHHVSVICGGAGTGKTTVLRAVLASARSIHGDTFPVHLAALSGRAAKRMAEATGTSALTVYRLLIGLRRGELPSDEGLLILDEASMLDLPIAYSILRVLGPSKRLLLVGDPAQLPPIGPGLVFHRMVGSPHIPQIALKQIHRQTSDTGIPAAGAMIREGTCPPLTTFDFAAPDKRGIFLAPADTRNVASTALRVLEALAGPEIGQGVRQRDIQVLCAIRKGPAGSLALNEAIEARHRGQHSETPWGLQLGSKIVWLVNDHHRGSRERSQSLLNGALGFIVGIDTSSLTAEFDDGTTHRLRPSDLAKLERGWAISIHKAQGSAFCHVVVPLVSTALLDRALVYTAITRATHSVVLIGSSRLLAAAIERPTTATRRRVGLQLHGADRQPRSSPAR